MKICILTLCVLNIVNLASSEIRNSDKSSFFRECVEEFGIAIEGYKYPKINLQNVPRCFRACIMKKRGTLYKGKINDERMFVHLRRSGFRGSDILRKKVTSCAHIANHLDRECDVANTMVKCLFKIRIN